MFGELQDARVQEAAYAQQLAALQETNRQLHYYLLYPDRAVTLELWSEASRKEIGAVLEAILSE